MVAYLAKSRELFGGALAATTQASRIAPPPPPASTPRLATSCGSIRIGISPVLKVGLDQFRKLKAARSSHIEHLTVGVVNDALGIASVDVFVGLLDDTDSWPALLAPAAARVLLYSSAAPLAGRALDTVAVASAGGATVSVIDSPSHPKAVLAGLQAVVTSVCEERVGVM